VAAAVLELLVAVLEALMVALATQIMVVVAEQGAPHRHLTPQAQAPVVLVGVEALWVLPLHRPLMEVLVVGVAQQDIILLETLLLLGLQQGQDKVT
jgi:hypothetical protein